MFDLPSSTKIDVAKLSSVFKNVTMTYKYYFFLAILHEVKKNVMRDSLSLDKARLGAAMLGLAWHARTVYALNFGIGDKLQALIDELKLCLNLGDRESTDKIIDEIYAHKDDAKVSQIISLLLNYVPVKFLSGYVGSAPDTKAGNLKIALASQDQDSHSIYKLYLNEKGKFDHLVIDNEHLSYLRLHISILTDFTYFHLGMFFEKRNLSVPNILDKIIWQKSRDSLAPQRGLFKIYLEHHSPQFCLYDPQRLLNPQDFALDHFIPWSFVSHNQIWNLIPVDQITNSIKSNAVPDLSHYLKALVHMHYGFLQDLKYARLKPQSKSQEQAVRSFESLGQSLKNLQSVSESELAEIYFKVMDPLAKQAGFAGFAVFA